MPFAFGTPDEPAGYLMVQTPSLAIYGQWPMGGDRVIGDPGSTGETPKGGLAKPSVTPRWQPIVVEGGKGE